MADSATHILWLMLLSVLCTGGSIVLAYMSKWVSVALALAALLLAWLSGYVLLPASTIIFWSAASALALGICLLLPAHIRDSRVGMPYFSTGALMGMALGMLFNSSAGIITCCAAGTLLSAVAFSRTDKSNRLDFPSRRFFNYLCAKGLPLVVVMSMAGICIISILNSSLPR